MKWEGPIRVAIADLTSATNTDRTFVIEQQLKSLAVDAALDLKIVEAGDLSFDERERNILIAFVDIRSTEIQIAQLDNFINAVNTSGITQAAIPLSQMFKDATGNYLEVRFDDRGVTSGSITVIDVSKLSDIEQQASVQMAIAPSLLPQLKFTNCYSMSLSVIPAKGTEFSAWFIELLRIAYDKRLVVGSKLELIQARLQQAKLRQ